MKDLKEHIQTILEDTTIPIEERIAQVDRIYSDAVKAAEIRNQEDEKFAALLSDYAQFLQKYARYPKAIIVYLRQIALSEQLYGKDHPSTATSYNGIGLVYFEQGKINNALEFFQKALNIREKVLGSEHKDTATSYNNIGWIYDEQRDYDKALEFYYKALDIREKVLGSNHPDTAKSYNNIGIVYYNQGDYDKALHYLLNSLSIIEHNFGENHPDTASTYNNLGLVYYNQGNYGKALENFNKAINIREQVLGLNHPDTAWSYHNLGLVFYSQGDYIKALESFNKAINIRKQVLDKNNSFTADSYIQIGGVYKALKDYDNALKYYKMALEIRERESDIDKPLRAVVYNNIGEVYEKLGKIHKAKEYYSKSIPIIEKKLGVEKADSVSGKDIIYNQNYYRIIDDVTECTAKLNNNFSFQKAMLSLADDLRIMFKSEYCAIGIVDGNLAEDCIVSLDRYDDEEEQKRQAMYLESIRYVDITKNTNILLCRALAEKSQKIISFSQQEIKESETYEQFITHVMKSRQVFSNTVIPLRDNFQQNIGYVQFLNSADDIDFNRIEPLLTTFLALTNTILQKNINQKNEYREKDFEFYDTMHSAVGASDLVDKIMEYLSIQFNAAIVTFRIPIVNAPQKDLSHFYLRGCYVNDSIPLNKEIKDYYLEDRVLIPIAKMGGYKALLSGNNQQHFIYNDVIDTSYYKKYNLELHDKLITVPVFRDDTSDEPLINQLYGTFQLRLFKPTISSVDKKIELISLIRFERELDEAKIRLEYLSQQITLLFNSYVHRFENESLQIFQNELKNSSFVKIHDFDERCVNIIQKSVRANACSIYRLDNSNKKLLLSATTVKEIHLNEQDENIDVISYKDKCSIPIESGEKILTIAFREKRPMYIYDIRDSQTLQSSFIEQNFGGNHSAMAVPLINKKGEPLGVVLLLGKVDSCRFISTAYWEHDISHIEFIVNTLSRISESDNERMTFLSQLSHELLSPVTELVYNNDYIVNLAERDINCLTKQQLITTIRNNMDTCMQLKYIICDTEFRYATSGKNMDYNIVKQDNPQEPLLDAIRLLEKEAHEKGLIIKAYTSKMPPMYFDKERMMQVFINLLKNAIRYADDYSTIEVFYKQEKNGFHEIRFVNRGIGVREEEKEAIFELFYRGEDAKRKSDRGSGIGLYIIRDIMRAHGGDCYVRNLKNPTEFVIILPDKQ